MSETERSAQFLNKVYQNAQMACDSVTTVAQKASDAELLSDLNTQRQQYSGISEKAAGMLAQQNELPKEINPISQASAWSGIQMNTLLNKSPDRIAEIMIQGSVMGIIDMTRTLKQYEDVPESVRSVGYELVTAQQNSLERMKRFLG